MRPWLGFLTLAAGVALWLAARWERAIVPAWVPRLAVGVSFLGLSTLAATRQEPAWSYVSIACSLVAIIMIVRVIRDMLRRQK